MSIRSWFGTLLFGIVAGSLFSGLIFALAPWVSVKNASTISAPSFDDNRPNQQLYPQNADQGLTGDTEFNPWQEGVAQYVMAVFTIIMAVTAIYAAKWLRETLIETRKAVLSAENAAESSREATNIIRSEQRPWLIVRKAEFKRLDRSEDQTHFRFWTNFAVEIENTGKAPAVNVRFRCNAVFRYLPTNNFEGSKPIGDTDGALVYDSGVENFISQNSAGTLAGVDGMDNYVIGQNQVFTDANADVFVGVVIVPKNHPDRFAEYQSFVVSIAYQGTSGSVWYESHFAFDILGRNEAADYCAPVGNSFADGGRLCLRPSKSNLT